jgi:CubicO group peptidase (beta-lactamase class C family)
MFRTTLITIVAAVALVVTGAASAASSTTPQRTPVSSLTRIYRGDDGGVLYLRQLDGKVYGFGEHPGLKYAYVVTGPITGDRIAGTWWDVAKGTRKLKGTIDLQWSQYGARIVRKSGDDLGPDVFTAIPPTGVPWPTRQAAGFQSYGQNDLDGLWLGDDASRLYVAGVAEREAQPDERPGWVSVFLGTRTGATTFSGTWVDVPKGLTHESGTFGAAFVGDKRELRFEQTGTDRTRTLVPEYTLDWDGLVNQITGTLDGNVVGYAYAIARHGAIIRSGAAGLRRLAIDGGELPFTTKTQAQTASAAKTINATAIIKALNDRGLSVDQRVAPYLPSCWKKGKDVDSLTFRQILNHTSGLPKVSCNGGDGYLCLLKMIEEGRTQPRTKSYNTHAYDLVRLLTPMVLDRAGTMATFELFKCKNSDGILNGKISEKYARYMFDEILHPVGAEASFYPSGDFSLDYDFSKQSLKGEAPRIDYFKRAGSGKLTMTVLDYIRFLSALDRGLILPKGLVETMKGTPGDRLGFDSAYDGTAGDYAWKNGGCPDFDEKTRGCKTVAMTYPGDTQIYIAVNSDNNGFSGSMQSLAGRAFDAALK